MKHSQKMVVIPEEKYKALLEKQQQLEDKGKSSESLSNQQEQLKDHGKQEESLPVEKEIPANVSRPAEKIVESPPVIQVDKKKHKHPTEKKLKVKKVEALPIMKAKKRKLKLQPPPGVRDVKKPAKNKQQTWLKFF